MENHVKSKRDWVVPDRCNEPGGAQRQYICSRSVLKSNYIAGQMVARV